MSSSHQGSLRGTTLYEIAKGIQKADPKSGKVNQNSPSIVEGLKPKKPPMQEGYHIFGPEELASLLVPRQELTENHTIAGFQRDITRPHIRRIAVDLEKNEPMPVLEIALYRNALWAVDGQHRGLGAILARENMPVVIRHMTADEMKKLFASQAKARRVNPSTLILSSDNPFAEYVQDAVTASNVRDNPWFGMVTHKTSSQTQLTPAQVFEAIAKYVSSIIGTHTGNVVDKKVFEREKADELAYLFRAFGTKRTNPWAFRPIAVRAITYAAVLIIRRQGSIAEDLRRWQNHMPQFPWEEYAHLRKSKDLALALIGHWNKRLHARNKVLAPDISV